MDDPTVTPKMCEVTHGSQVPAIGLFTWGSYQEHAKGYPHQRGYLCDACSSELWEKIKGRVSLGDCHFIVDRLPLTSSVAEASNADG